MKAKLLPLDGKYYGTKIKVSDGAHSVVFEVWLDPSLTEPSDRELEGICTIEQWRANEALDPAALGPGWSEEWPDGVTAKEAYEICNCHYESRETLAFARKIVDAINRYGRADWRSPDHTAR